MAHIFIEKLLRLPMTSKWMLTRVLCVIKTLTMYFLIRRKGSGPIWSGREECMHVARWIPRGIDMFVILKDTFRIARYMEAEEAAKTSTESEEEDVKKERKEALSVV